MNFATAFLDGSAIYGSTPESADKLREFDGGFLKVIILVDFPILKSVSGLYSHPHIFYLIEQKGMTFDQDFGYSRALFSSLLKKREEEK